MQRSSAHPDPTRLRGSWESRQLSSRPLCLCTCYALFPGEASEPVLWLCYLERGSSPGETGGQSSGAR